MVGKSKSESPADGALADRSVKLQLNSQDLFDSYLLDYELTHSYKKVLSTMIKFEDMYRPIVKGPMFVDPFRTTANLNEEREMQRTRIYLNKRDLINTFDEDRGRRLVVTSRGRKIFYEDYPLAKLRNEPWDGVWTMAMYDFPEEERVLRNLTRRRLIRLGFGCPQISILVSPLSIQDPIQELIEGEKLADFVWVLRAERILGMGDREVVRKAWPIIDELNTLYGELLSALPAAQAAADNSEFLHQWRKYFLAVNNADPYLPLELLPEDWTGSNCEQEFLRLGRSGFLKAVFGRSLFNRKRF